METFEIILIAMGALWGVLSAIMLMVSQNLYKRLHDMENRLNNLHDTYAKRDDVNRDFMYIRESLKRIEEKLDHKADK